MARISWRTPRASLTVQVLGAVSGGVIALAIISAISVWEMASLNRATSVMMAEEAHMSEALLELEAALGAARADVGLVASYPEAQRTERVSALAEVQTLFEEELAAFGASYEEIFHSPSPHLADAEAAWRAYRVAVDTRLIPAAKGGDLEAFAAAHAGAVTQVATLDESLMALEEDVLAALDAVETEHAARANQLTVLMIVLAVVGTAIASAIGVFVARRIATSADALKRSMTALAAGDLTVEANVSSNDEIGAACAARHHERDQPVGPDGGGSLRGAIGGKPAGGGRRGGELGAGGRGGILDR